MCNALENLFWCVFGIVFEYLLITRWIPFYYSSAKAIELRKKKKLYYSNKTTDCMRTYYGNYLYNCKIGTTSKQIPYIVMPEWTTLQIDAYLNKSILKPIQTDACTYPIHKTMIKRRQKQGQRLFDGSSHFLHQVVYNNGDINFELGEYEYFRRISYVHDFEKEGFEWVWKGRRNKTTLRQKYLPVPVSASLLSPNTVPVGCDVVIALLLNGKYHICIHERSEVTVNYPGGTMVTPTFGLEQLSHPGIDNLLLYACLKEYAEELYNREEVEDISSHPSPTWFYYQYQEVAEMRQLLSQGKAKFILSGCGFDAIGGFMNLATLLVVDDAHSAEKIFYSSHGNWEARTGSVRFVPIDSNELETLLQSNKLCPASAFAISRAISILNP